MGFVETCARQIFVHNTYKPEKLGDESHCFSPMPLQYTKIKELFRCPLQTWIFQSRVTWKIKPNYAFWPQLALQTDRLFCFGNTKSSQPGFIVYLIETIELTLMQSSGCIGNGTKVTGCDHFASSRSYLAGASEQISKIATLHANNSQHIPSTAITSGFAAFRKTLKRPQFFRLSSCFPENIYLPDLTKRDTKKSHLRTALLMQSLPQGPGASEVTSKIPQLMFGLSELHLLSGCGIVRLRTVKHHHFCTET